jgi:Flp pilus assembly protein TadG
MKLLKDEEGQAVVFMATFLSLLALGFLALAVDVGYFFHEKRVAQSAADAAAIAAAEESSYGTSSEQSAAYAIAKLNGFDTTLATNPAVVTVGTPTSGNYSGNSSYVQVVVTKPIQTLFLGAFQRSSNTITIAARAVAGHQSAANCVIGLNATGVSTANAPIYGYPNDNADIAVSGGGTLKAPGCGVCGNSPGGTSVYAVGSGSISALSVSSPGGDFSTGGGSITATNGVTNTGCTNPLAGKLTAPSLGTCSDPPWMAGNAAGTVAVVGGQGAGGAAKAISSGTYCNFNTANVSTLSLGPGTYVFQGNFSTNSGTTINCPTCTGGAGVFLYFAPGSTMNSSVNNSEGSSPDGIVNGVTLNLTAATSGTYAGVLMWDNSGTSSSPDTFTFGGGANSSLTGSIYMPNTNLDLGNGTNTGAMSSLIVANSIAVQGGSTVTDNATSSTLSTGGSVGNGLVE